MVGERPESRRTSPEGTDQDVHWRDVPAREAVVRQDQHFGLAKNVVGLERRAAAGRSGRPPSSTSPGR